MPFYEYVCQACQHHFEAMQKVTDAPLKKCPQCGKARLQKLVSAPSFQLKGTGWYVTDFKNKNAPPAKEVGTEKTDTDKDKNKDKDKDKSADKTGDKPSTVEKKAEKTPADKKSAETKSTTTTTTRSDDKKPR